MPEGAYIFSSPVDMPQVPDTDYMFGVGSMPEDAGNTEAPYDFISSAPDKGEK